MTTERIDHATKAREALAELDVTDPNESNLPADWCGASADEQWLVHATLEEAQVHATLALVEQQRISNLFMLHAMVPVGNLTEKARDELDKAFPLQVGNWEEELGLS